MGGADQTIRMSKQYKGSFVDKLGYKQIKLQKSFERSRRIMDNAYFRADERDQKKIFKNAERGTDHVGQIIPKMDKFVYFWENIREKLRE